MKIKGNIKTARQIKNLRGDTPQAEFAKRFGVTQPMVSAWELGRALPPVSVLLKLGSLAPYPACFDFWEQAGLNKEAIMSAAGKLLRDRMGPEVEGEVVRVPRVHLTRQGREEAGPSVRLDAKAVPNPLATLWISLDPELAAQDDQADFLFLVDTSIEDTRDLSSLWGKLVMVRHRRISRPTGDNELISVGRLVLRTESSRNVGESPFIRVNAVLLHFGGDWPMSLGNPQVENMEGISPKVQARRAQELRERAKSTLQLESNVNILGEVLGHLAGKRK